MLQACLSADEPQGPTQPVLSLKIQTHVSRPLDSFSLTSHHWKLNLRLSSRSKAFHLDPDELLPTVLGARF